ncbi:hypothetical protein N1031_11450 [Herbiconiux moechotypicola]|uniref:Uncharacterized protein n=1 Tax=Herbiconiux moechotypicola TaxID=637393 RepID=A0ABN3DNT7_9MICO|nr:hypothetical protein [Herbiconiux moechotypicola]MCS5730377.1 hypothetical protein [Herbiconiux moechotypicola]
MRIRRLAPGRVAPGRVFPGRVFPAVGGVVLSAMLALASVVFGAAIAAQASSWAGSHDEAAPPALAQTGYDFTPMLVTAAVFLVIAGVAVLVAKYALARSRHS